MDHRGGRSIEELERERDTMLLELLATRRNSLKVVRNESLETETVA